MRYALATAILLVTAGLAGCIQGGEPLDPASAPADARDDPSSEEASEPGESNASSQADSESGAEEARPPSNATDANERHEPPSRDDPRPPLPANVTLANATVVEQTEDSATFRWNGTAPNQPQPGLETLTRNLTVPPDRWLEVNATLTWDERPGVSMGVFAYEDDLARCYGTPQFRDASSTDGVKICESRPQPLDGWRTWEINVAAVPLLPLASGAASSQPVDFTVDLTVENVGPDGPWGDLERSPGQPGAWTPAEQAEIRPAVVEWTGSQCTLNVLFTSPEASSVYAGSAAHCHSGEAIGTMVHLGGIPNAGRLVYCAWGTELQGEGQAACPNWDDSDWNTTQENDFALVEIKPSLVDEVNPKLPYWGGPTGMAEPVELGEGLMIYGNSSYRDADRDDVPDALDPIRALAVDQTERTVVMEAPGVVFGDSGGPALDSEGRALGIASILAVESAKTAPGEVWYANLSWAVSFMEEHTHLEVELLTAPLEERPYNSVPEGP